MSEYQAKIYIVSSLLRFKNVSLLVLNFYINVKYEGYTFSNFNPVFLGMLTTSNSNSFHIFQLCNCGNVDKK